MFPRRHIVLNIANGKAKKLVNRSHPMHVTFCQVVVYCDDVHAAPC